MKKKIKELEENINDLDNNKISSKDTERKINDLIYKIENNEKNNKSKFNIIKKKLDSNEKNNKLEKLIEENDEYSKNK